MASESFFPGETLRSLMSLPRATGGTTVAILAIVTLLYLYRKLGTGSKRNSDGQAYPPCIPSPIPFLGHAVEFGRSPIDFLLKAHRKYGGVFSFTMVGKTFTYAIGSDPCAIFFNSKNEDLNAEEVYSKLVTPVFGKGVAYDVPNKTVGGYTVPAGHQLCVSPTVNSQLQEVWDDPNHFNPDRFLDKNAADSEKFAYVPFGAGRHRCVGESFAYTQIKTIWSVLLTKYEFSLIDGFFPPVNYSTMIHTPTRPIIAYKRR